MMEARSPLECHLYIELNPCSCGGRADQTQHRLVTIEDRLCARYQGHCSSCGAELAYVFALADEIVPPDRFGGAAPSMIIDAGQFMAVSEHAAKQVRLPAPTDDARRASRSWLERAVACLDEILKWLPDGHDEIPSAAFFTAAGRAAFDREPGRFRRARLSAVRMAYAEMLLEVRG